MHLTYGRNYRSIFVAGSGSLDSLLLTLFLPVDDNGSGGAVPSCRSGLHPGLQLQVPHCGASYCLGYVYVLFLLIISINFDFCKRLNALLRERLLFHNFCFLNKYQILHLDASASTHFLFQESQGHDRALTIELNNFVLTCSYLWLLQT